MTGTFGAKVAVKNPEINIIIGCSEKPCDQYNQRTYSVLETLYFGKIHIWRSLFFKM